MVSLKTQLLPKKETLSITVSSGTGNVASSSITAEILAVMVKPTTSTTKLKIEGLTTTNGFPVIHSPMLSYPSRDYVNGVWVKKSGIPVVAETITFTVTECTVDENIVVDVFYK